MGIPCGVFYSLAIMGIPCGVFYSLAIMGMSCGFFVLPCQDIPMIAREYENTTSIPMIAREYENTTRHTHDSKGGRKHHRTYP
jgi:ABC-type uncharacterized transport system permease subunit